MGTAYFPPDNCLTPAALNKALDLNLRECDEDNNSFQLFDVKVRRFLGITTFRLSYATNCTPNPTYLVDDVEAEIIIESVPEAIMHVRTTNPQYAHPSMFYSVYLRVSNRMVNKFLLDKLLLVGSDGKPCMDNLYHLMRKCEPTPDDLRKSWFIHTKRITLGGRPCDVAIVFRNRLFGRSMTVDFHISPFVPFTGLKIHGMDVCKRTILDKGKSELKASFKNLSFKLGRMCIRVR